MVLPKFRIHQPVICLLWFVGNAARRRRGCFYPDRYPSAQSAAVQDRHLGGDAVSSRGPKAKHPALTARTAHSSARANRARPAIALGDGERHSVGGTFVGVHSSGQRTERGESERADLSSLRPRCFVEHEPDFGWRDRVRSGPAVGVAESEGRSSRGCGWWSVARPVPSR